MEKNKKIKLIRYIKLLKEKTLLIGESIDWFKVGNRKKREELKELGIEITIIKNKYINYFVKDTSLFKGNIVVVVIKKSIKSKELLRIIKVLEEEMGILSLFLINEKRVLSVKYLMGLLKDNIDRENIVRLLLSQLNMGIGSLGVINRSLIKVISRIKEN